MSVNTLEEQNLLLQKEVNNLKNIIHQLEEELAWFKRQIFGKKSEKIISENSNQLTFEGFEMQQSDEENTEIIREHRRSKSKKKGEETITISSDLPVKTIVLDIPEEEKFCKETGDPLIKIGEEKTYKLAHKPGSYYIKKIIRPKYAKSKKPHEGIFIRELPEGIIPKCRADNSFLAEIITKKFADHLPLYRIAEIVKREGIGISHKLLSAWVVCLGNTLKLLYNEMAKKVFQENNIFIDETPVKMLAKNKCKDGYLWTVVGGRTSDPPYRIYYFKENRCNKHASDILANYHGVVHSDKYSGYQKLAEQKVITWAPCWSHIRRKFFEAEAGDLVFRKWVLRKIRYLFMLEKIAWAHNPEKRLKIRQEKEVPIIDELISKIKERLTNGKYLPKSNFYKALGYFCGLIPYLKNYTKYPFARLDNNVAERAIRPIAIGRKNWMFFGSKNGGETGAILLSLVQTCRGLGINPRVYLEDVFDRIMDHSSNKLEELLPDRWLLAKKKSD